MLPILQALAVAAVINRFITSKLGQPYTVIAMDQPLYSRGKELVWANQNSYKDVVLVMGQLHIIFNFLTAIGQHIENTGLTGIWVESGAFAEGSTVAMMEGKAYYRTVRDTHFLMRPYGKYTGKNPSLSTKVVGIIEEFDAKKTTGNDIDGIQRSEGDLMEALDEENNITMMEKVDNEFSDFPNFVFWQAYMKMLEILLDFIRANRDGYWSLQLSSFAAILPWMTIYDHTNYARWGPVYLGEMKAWKFHIQNYMKNSWTETLLLNEKIDDLIKFQLTRQQSGKIYQMESLA